MPNIRKIIKTAVYLNFLLTISIGIAGVSTEKPASPYELVSMSLKKQSQSDPNKNNKAYELLDKFAQTKNKLKSYRIVCESIQYTAVDHPVVKDKGEWKYDVLHTDFSCDGKRWSYRLKRWLNLDSPNESLIEDSVSYNYNRDLWDGNTVFSYAKGADSLGTLKISKEPDVERTDRITDYGPRKLMGFFIDDQSIDQIFRQYKNGVSVRDEMETVGDSNCYVIDADIEYGKYTIWIDPEHGYNIAKGVVEKTEGHLTDKLTGGERLEAGYSISESYTVTHFEQADGIWLPMESRSAGAGEWPGGYSKGEGSSKIISFVLNPDHEALKSFELDKDEVLDGARVFITGVSGIQYTWRDGKIVDSYGHEVNLDNLGPPSLVGKALPDLAQFNVRLNPDAIKDKMLLVCFWDMDQRPSRNAILTLNKNAQTLLDKNDVYMVFIHAGSVEEQAFVSWLKQNQIQPPVGVSRTGLPELGYTWGVQSLPWLILTDKKHIVTAEGFAYNELDEKIVNIK